MKAFLRLSAVLLSMLLLSACGGDPGGGADKVKPTITLIGSPTVTVEVGDTYTDAGASASDNVDGNITDKIVVHSPVDTSKVGTYTITYDVNDTAGNAADQVTRTVVVVAPTADTTPPVITLNGNTIVRIMQFSTYTDSGATATDDVDGAVSVTTTGGVDTDNPNSYTITYTATDNAGNSITATRTVTVTPFSITHNGTSYSVVKSPYTGKFWLDRNLGAAQVCQSFDDVACYGDYYQWGRNFDGHQDSGSAITTTQATDVYNAGSSFIESSSTYSDDWAQAADSNGSIRQINWFKTDGTFVCPVGFRVPTIDELKEETTDNGVTDRDTAFSNFLKLPSAGFRDFDDGLMYDVGSWGDVWVASTSGSGSPRMNFGSNSAGWADRSRAYGQSVRCLKF